MKLSVRSFLAIAGLTAMVGAQGCVADRPARNGVFDENQYIRKAWLIRSGDLDSNGNPLPDNGWMLKTTITDVSTPNPLSAFEIQPAIQNAGEQVRFVVTSDKLQMVSMREMNDQASAQRTQEVENAWAITNVDLKYQVNLDGENTNFYQENQENDWAIRQWVKVNFDKNDMSDVAPLGAYFTDSLEHCTDIGNASATLVPGSFIADEQDDYMQFSVSITVPLKFDDQTCVDQYGQLGTELLQLGKSNVTFNLKYSMIRALSDADAAAGTPASGPGYTPLAVAEKDDIRHKYGPITYLAVNRDMNSQLLAATEYAERFNPNKPIVWYFDKSFPANLKAVCTNESEDPNNPDPTTIKTQTNALLAQAGVAARVDFRDADDVRDMPANMPDQEVMADGSTRPIRTFGDARYSFITFVNDLDMIPQGEGADTQGWLDPRSGEELNARIVVYNFPFTTFTEQINAYLLSVGSADDINSATPWPDPPGGSTCTPGDTVSIFTDPTVAQTTKNANSSLFGKIQAYLGKSIAAYGNLAPSDFVAVQDQDFAKAYYALNAYNIFADPDMNQYVTREGGQGVYGPADLWNSMQQDQQFHALSTTIDRGQFPYDNYSATGNGTVAGAGLVNSVAFANQMRDLTINHQNLTHARDARDKVQGLFRDGEDMVSFLSVMKSASRRCLPSGTWETKEQWVSDTIQREYAITIWHEFGHALGMDHNFMGSADLPNFPPPVKDSKGVLHNTLYASTVMDYNATPVDPNYTPQWGPFDQAEIAWIYANNAPNQDQPSVVSISGQNNPTSPWKDPLGFNSDGTEKNFLQCTATHMKYTPLCRQFDLGTTPSEIIANEIEDNEWRYNWRNFRTYHKIFSYENYPDAIAGYTYELKRFISMWAFDWSEAELTGTLHRIGINAPAGVPAQHYFDQLTHKFTIEMSATNSLVAAYHKAVIQESSGERPFATVYDRFYGDELQQGIILDKYYAMQGWVGLWPTDNYDQNQAGSYIASYSDFGEPFYLAVANDAVTSMVGSQYDVYPYFIPTAVGLFAQDTHNPAFTGYIQDRDWIGGLTFYRLQDFQDYFKNIAVQQGGFTDSNGTFTACTDITTCTYDATNVLMTGADTWNQFTGPDGLVYIWSYVQDRNTWVMARMDRNIATYKILHAFNDDLLKNLDDGSGGTYGFLLPIKYTLDSFVQFN